MDSATDSNMTKIDSILKGLSGTTTATTLLSSAWSNGVYSFESTYPSATYDIFIELNGDSITAEQMTAWSKAKVLGSVNGNTYKATGVVPTIDVPVIIRVVKR